MLTLQDALNKFYMRCEAMGISQKTLTTYRWEYKASAGKTTYVLQMADYLASQGNDVLYFSLEMSRAQLFAKSVSRLTYMYCLNHKGENQNDCPHPKTFADVLFGRKHDLYSKHTTFYKLVKEYEESLG